MHDNNIIVTMEKPFMANRKQEIIGRGKIHELNSFADKTRIKISEVNSATANL